MLDIDNRNVTELPDSVMEDSDDINQETLWVENKLKFELSLNWHE